MTTQYSISKNRSQIFQKAILFVMVLCSGLHTAHAQFVKIQIELPARSEVQLMSGVLAGQKGKASTGQNSSSCLQWLGISVSENMELTVEISYRILPSGESSVPAAYLNNGTSNISQAILFTANRAVFAVNDGGRLIKKMHGPPGSLTAWIGVPPTQTSELMIEYN